MASKLQQVVFRSSTQVKPKTTVGEGLANLMITAMKAGISYSDSVDERQKREDKQAEKVEKANTAGSELMLKEINSEWMKRMASQNYSEMSSDEKTAFNKKAKEDFLEQSSLLTPEDYITFENLFSKEDIAIDNQRKTKAESDKTKMEETLFLQMKLIFANEFAKASNEFKIKGNPTSKEYKSFLSNFMNSDKFSNVYDYMGTDSKLKVTTFLAEKESDIYKLAGDEQKREDVTRIRGMSNPKVLNNESDVDSLVNSAIDKTISPKEYKKEVLTSYYNNVASLLQEPQYRDLSEEEIYKKFQLLKAYPELDTLKSHVKNEIAIHQKDLAKRKYNISIDKAIREGGGSDLILQISKETNKSIDTVRGDINKSIQLQSESVFRNPNSTQGMIRAAIHQLKKSGQTSSYLDDIVDSVTMYAPQDPEGQYNKFIELRTAMLNGYVPSKNTDAIDVLFELDGIEIKDAASFQNAISFYKENKDKTSVITKYSDMITYDSDYEDDTTKNRYIYNKAKEYSKMMSVEKAIKLAESKASKTFHEVDGFNIDFTSVKNVNSKEDVELVKSYFTTSTKEGTEFEMHNAGDNFYITGTYPDGDTFDSFYTPAQIAKIREEEAIYLEMENILKEKENAVNMYKEKIKSKEELIIQGSQTQGEKIEAGKEFILNVKDKFMGFYNNALETYRKSNEKAGVPNFKIDFPKK